MAATSSKPVDVVSGDQEVANGVFHYQIVGGSSSDASLELVVMLHGFTLNSWYMKPLAQAIAQTGRYRVLLFDFLGNGHSVLNKPADFKYTQNFHNSSICELLEKLGLWSDSLHPVTVIGHSMGGATAAGLAVHYPKRVSRCVLLDPAGLPVVIPFSAKLITAPIIGPLLQRFAFKQGLMDSAADDFFNKSHPGIAEYHEQLQWQMDHTPHYISTIVSTLSNFGLNGGFVEQFDALGKMADKQVLVVWGDKDAVCPFETSIPHLQKVLHKAQFVILKYSGHAVTFEAGPQTQEAVLTFLCAN